MHPPAGAGLVGGSAPLARLGPGLRWLARLALALCKQSLCDRRLQPQEMPKAFQYFIIQVASASGFRARRASAPAFRACEISVIVQS